MSGSSSVPDDLRYSKEHEWVRADGDTALVGITAFAQEQLGDVVFVELPEKGSTVRQHASFGVVESVKAASDVYAPTAARSASSCRPPTTARTSA